METKKRICLLLAALLSLSGVLPVSATDYQASDYLPLAVGNSWTYTHEFYDIERRYGDRSQWSAYMAQVHDPSRFTITVLRTEVIDGKTYYVLSDMPANWPPAPPHFIAGKKLRWRGTHLMEHTGGGEQAIYRFDGASEDYIPSTDLILDGIDAYKTEYSIPTQEGDNRIKVIAGLEPVPWYAFEFLGNGEGGRACNFLAGYGISSCGWGIFGTDHLLFTNDITALRAIIGGTPVEIEDAWIPTASASSSWGQIKQSLLVQSPGGTGR